MQWIDKDNYLKRKKKGTYYFDKILDVRLQLAHFHFDSSSEWSFLRVFFLHSNKSFV